MIELYQHRLNQGIKNYIVGFRIIKQQNSSGLNVEAQIKKRKKETNQNQNLK